MVSVQGDLCWGSLSKGPFPEGLCPGFSVKRVSVQGSLSKGFLSRGLCPEVSVQRGLCPGESLSGVFCPIGLGPKGLCPGASLSRGSLSGVLCQKGPLSEVSVQGHLCHRGFSVQGSLSARPRTVMCRWYVSYWNAFLLRRFSIRKEQRNCKTSLFCVKC